MRTCVNLAIIVRKINWTIIHPPPHTSNSQDCNSNICNHTEARVGVKPADCAVWSQHFHVAWLQLIAMEAQRIITFITSPPVVKYKNEKSN
jgi:hypothetical protein